MEFLIGAIVTLVAMAILNNIYGKITPTPRFNLKYRQSNTFELIKPAINIIMFGNRKDLVTQSTKHHESNSLKVLVIEQEAYWIANNTVFVANLVGGSVDQNSARAIDTMAMDDVQLKKIIFVVEQLTGGHKNDGRSARNS